MEIHTLRRYGGGEDAMDCGKQLFPLRSSTANGVRMPSRNPPLHLSQKHLDVACEKRGGAKPSCRLERYCFMRF